MGIHICNVRLLELIETGQCSCSSHSSQDVCSCALEEGWDSLILQNLHRTVQRSRIFDRLSRGHHHPSTDRTNWVRCQSHGHCDSISESKRGQSSTSFRHHGSYGVIESKIEPAIHKDANSGNNKSTVQSTNTIRLQGLFVNIKESGILSLCGSTSLLHRFHVIRQSRSSVIQRVHEGQRRGSCTTTGRNILSQFHIRCVGLLALELSFDSFLKHKVESLSGEISQAVCRISSPHRQDTLFLGHSAKAIHRTFISLLESARFDHLVLVLNHKFNSLDGSSHRFGNNSSTSREGEVLDWREDGVFLPHIGEPIGGMTGGCTQAKVDRSEGFVLEKWKWKLK